MNKYLRVAATGWQKAMVYRWNTLLEVFGYMATMLISIALWRFVFQQTGKGAVAGYTASEMISYLMVAGWLASAFWFTAQGNRIINDIKDGVISNYLVKPMRILGYYLAYGLVGKVFQIVCSSIVFGVLLGLFWKTGISFFSTIEPLNLALFLVFFVLAALIQFFIFYNAGMSAFWMEESWGIAFVVRVFADIAAGAFLPLTMFSLRWQEFFSWLPFRYTISIPANILLGRLSVPEILIALGGALAWLILLYLGAIILLRLGIRHYRATGG